MNPDDNSELISISNIEKSSQEINDTTTNRLERILQGISVETIEAEAIMYLATYYHDNNDFDSAAMYVMNISEN
jgi:hypothetical protein